MHSDGCRASGCNALSQPLCDRQPACTQRRHLPGGAGRLCMELERQLTHNLWSGCVKCCHEGMIRKIAALLHRRHHPAPSHPVAGELGWAAERWSHQTGNILHFPSSPGSTFECVTVIVAACSFFLVQHEPVLTSEEQKHQRAM